MRTLDPRAIALAVTGLLAAQGAYGQASVQPARIRGTFPLVEGVSELHDGSIALVDRGGPGVTHLRMTSGAASTAGGFGDGLGQFRNPIDLVADAATVWVLDRFQPKLTVFEIHGTAMVPLRDITLDVTVDPVAIERAPGERPRRPARRLPRRVGGCPRASGEGRVPSSWSRAG